MADINKNEIFASDLNEPLVKLNAELKTTLTNMEKMVIEAKQLNNAMKQGGTKEAAANTNKLKQSQAQLNAETKALIKLDNQAKAAELQLSKEYQKAAKEVTRKKIAVQEANKATKQEIILEKTAKDSIVRMRAELRKMEAAYIRASGAVRKQMNPQLTAMRKKVVDAEKSMGNHTRNVGQYFQKAYVAAAAGIMTAVAAINRISGAIKESVGLFLEQQKQTFLVANTFGDYASEINKAADATQKLTTTGNEQYQRLAIQAKNFGVETSKTNEAVQGSIGLAAKFEAAGMSQETALKGVALAMQGDFMQLQRYIPALKTASTEAEKMAILQREMADGFLFAQEAAKTQEGKLTQLKNQIGDVKEEFGELAMKLYDAFGGSERISEWVERIDRLINIIDMITVKTEGSGSKIGKTMKTLMNIINPLGGAIKYINKLFFDSVLNVNDFNTELAVNRAELDMENTKMNKLIEATTSYNHKSGVRIELLKQINKEYPEFTQGLELEKVTNEQLTTVMDKLNKAYTAKRREMSYGIDLMIKEAELKQFSIQLDELLLEQIDAKAKGKDKKVKQIEADILDLLEQQSSVYSEIETIQQRSAGKSAMFELENGVISTREEFDKLQQDLKNYEQVLTDNLSSANVVQRGLMVKDLQTIRKLRAVEFNGMAADQNVINEATEKSAEFLKVEVERMDELTPAVKEATIAAMEFREVLIDDIAGEPTMFDRISASAEEFLNKIQSIKDKYGKEIGEIWNAGGQIADNIFARQSQELDQQAEADAAYWDARIAAYEGDANAQAQLLAQKTAAEEEYNRKQVEIERKKAIFDRSQAVFEIALRTAMGIMGALAMIPPNPILAAAVGIAGAAQTAAVLTAPMPQYAEGIENVPYKHDAIVGEKGREIIQYPDGSSILASSPMVTTLPKGASVIPNFETEKILQRMLFSNVGKGSDNAKDNYDMNILHNDLKSLERTLKRKPVANINSGYSLKDINYIKTYDV